MYNFALVGGLSLIGFVAGYAFGQKVRSSTPSNVSVGFEGGVATIEADVSAALSDGFTDLIREF